jgi:putative ABC transport system permease protein
MIRLRDDATGLPQALESIIASLDPAASVEVETATAARWAMFRQERFRTSLLLTFASTALFLAMVGVFGVVSYSVTERQREIGIRLTLGAANRDVVGLMLTQAMWPAMIGLGVGLLASIGLMRLLVSFLYEVEPTDPATFGIAATCLLLASIVASLIPARRATRVDPMTILRHE